MEMEINGGDLLDALGAIKATSNDEALITLKNDRWMIKSQDEATVLMAAVLVPENAMESYSKGSYSQVGFEIDKVEGFINDKKDTIQMWMEERALHMDDGSAHARIATINPGDVNGHMQGAPQLDYEAVVEGDPDFIFNFINRQENIAGAGSFFISPREDGVILYAEGDNGEMDYFESYDDFDSAEVDWSVNNTEGPDNMNIPAEDNAADAIMSTDVAKDIKKPVDECKMHFANQAPMMFQYDLGDDGEDGMKISFMQAPRVSNEGPSTVPERVVQKNI